MSHRNAPLTPAGRKKMIERIRAGTPQAHVAAQMCVSRATVSKWWRRWQTEGDVGLVDRSSRPRRIRMELDMPASTVHKVLCRHGLHRLRWIDRPTGEVIRRYERAHPGELIHVDIKKVGKIPPGGGWKVHGRGIKKRRKVGYTYLHVAVDDHSRVAYVEAHENEKAATLVGFWARAQEFFWTKGMIIDEVLTDNAKNFTSNAFAEALAPRAIKHRRIKPYRPQTNGKVERFNRTLADEFLYAHRFQSENERRRRLDRWVH